MTNPKERPPVGGINGIGADRGVNNSNANLYKMLEEIAEGKANEKLNAPLFAFNDGKQTSGCAGNA